MSRRIRPRLASQDGYTAIEMIITMALTAIVSGGIFSSFLVLDRIEVAWQERDQTRAVGVLAEQSIVRDVQAYQVMTVGSTLVLQAVGTAPLKITYFTAPGPSGAQLLMRTVQQSPNPPSVATTVAHGVESFNARCTGNSLTVSMTVDTISTAGPAKPIAINPDLVLTPRNGGCP